MGRKLSLSDIDTNKSQGCLIRGCTEDNAPLGLESQQEWAKSMYGLGFKVHPEDGPKSCFCDTHRRQLGVSA